MGVCFSISKIGHYTKECRDIPFVTDCKGIVEGIRKPLEDIKNAHLQKMFIDLPELDYNFQHVHGIENESQ